MKWFCSSDIHGFFTYWQEALIKAGFDAANPDHGLIILGDLWDRGPEDLEIYDFVRNFPRERRILIRGNHELLLKELVQKHRPDAYDKRNGTYDTLFQFSDIGLRSEKEFIDRYFVEFNSSQIQYGTEEYQKFNDKYNALIDRLYLGKVLEIIDWINSDEWLNYYETDKYIFVHSFIPTVSDMKSFVKKDAYDKCWRNANDMHWEEAMWGCPWKQFKEGLFDPEIDKGKILVCGHWHTADFWNNLVYKNEKDKQLSPSTDNPIFKTEKVPNLIGLDACTVLTHDVNILVLDEENM